MIEFNEFYKLAAALGILARELRLREPEIS